MTGDLSQRLLYDFHGNAPTIDESQTALPTITKKAAVYISSVLEDGQMFKFGIDGGGCSGFQYSFGEPYLVYVMTDLTRPLSACSD